VELPRGDSMPKPRPYTRKEIGRLWVDLNDSLPWCRCGKCKPEDQHEHALWWLGRWRNDLSRWLRVQAYFERAQMEAIVAFALMGGLRRIEIFNLTVDRAHPENHYIVVAGAAKNRAAVSEDRPVPWGGGDDMRATVQRWIDLRAELRPAHESLWLSLWRQRWAADPMPFGRFELLLSRVGAGYSLHRLRHTFATETLRAGMPVERLGKILGHASIQQTLAYAELVDRDLVKASERVQSNFTRAIARPAV
jgi:site-specific recombinase XerD